jgi:hypothetical protein
MTNKRQTKWSVLADRHNQLLAEFDDIQRKLDESGDYIAGLSKTKCGLTCSGCGTVLDTEEDFAKHFTIPDRRYLNLGECPVRDRTSHTPGDYGNADVVDLLDDPWGTKDNPSPLT